MGVGIIIIFPFSVPTQEYLFSLSVRQPEYVLIPNPRGAMAAETGKRKRPESYAKTSAEVGHRLSHSSPGAFGFNEENSSATMSSRRVLLCVLEKIAHYPC